LLGGCASKPQPKLSDHGNVEPISVAPSFLSSSSPDDVVGGPESPLITGLPSQASNSEGQDNPDQPAVMTLLTAVERPAAKTSTLPLLVDLFPDRGELRISANKMPLRDFLHYSLGELLQVNYILDPAIDDDQSAVAPVTLSLAKSMTQRQLFAAVSELLVKRNIQLRYGNDAFYVHLSNDSKSSNDIAVAIGRNLSDIPNTTQTILQVVPLNYGIKVALQSSVARLTDALVTPDYDQNALYIRGKRDAIVRALELVDMLDTPAARGQYIGMINLDFVTPSEFVEEVKVLMLSEGIITSVGSDDNAI
jgi:general secretion pathway protein D